MKKKPDRFERIVLDAIKKQDTPSSTCIWLSISDAVTLLRQEHRATLRLVRSELGICIRNAVIGGHEGVAEQWAARAAQCRDTLAKLKRRAT